MPFAVKFRFVFMAVAVNNDTLGQYKAVILHVTHFISAPESIATPDHVSHQQNLFLEPRDPVTIEKRDATSEISFNSSALSSALIEIFFHFHRDFLF